MDENVSDVSNNYSDLGNLRVEQAQSETISYK